MLKSVVTRGGGGHEPNHDRRAPALPPARGDPLWLGRGVRVGAGTFCSWRSALGREPGCFPRPSLPSPLPPGGHLPQDPASPLPGARRRLKAQGHAAAPTCPPPVVAARPRPPDPGGCGARPRRAGRHARAPLGRHEHSGFRHRAALARGPDPRGPRRPDSLRGQRRDRHVCGRGGRGQEVTANAQREFGGVANVLKWRCGDGQTAP